MFQEPRFSYPIVVLEGQGCRDLANLPIATVNVMATNDHGRNWCTDHTNEQRGSGIWHDHCAQVRACQMSGWLRRQTNVLPTLSQVNAQRVLWQKRYVIGIWIIFYATIAMKKTTRLPEAKVWIGSPIIATNAAASDAFLNKPSPTGNGKNP